MRVPPTSLLIGFGLEEGHSRLGGERVAANGWDEVPRQRIALGESIQGLEADTFS